MSWFFLVKTDDKNAKDVILSALEESEIITPRNRPKRLSYKDMRFGCFLAIRELSKNIYELGYWGVGQNTIKPSKEKNGRFHFGFDEKLKKSLVLLSNRIKLEFILTWNPDESCYNTIFAHESLKADIEKNVFYEEKSYFL